MASQTISASLPTDVLLSPLKAQSDASLAAIRRLIWAVAGFVLPATILGAWYWATCVQLVKPVFLPAPLTVLNAFQEMVAEEGYIGDVWISLSTVIRGSLWGIVIGLAAGTITASSGWAERLFSPFLNALRQVPALAWFPLIVLWIGIGPIAKELVIAKAVFFPVFLNTLQGIRSISPKYVEMGRMFGFTRIQMLQRVVLPGAAPTIFVGVRFAAGFAWAMVVAAEMLSGRHGLGFLLLQSQEMLETAQLFVVIVTIGTIGFVVDLGLRSVERRLFRWKEDISQA
jgi:sulfonate transport system permease protein